MSVWFVSSWNIYVLCQILLQTTTQNVRTYWASHRTPLRGKDLKLNSYKALCDVEGALFAYLKEQNYFIANLEKKQ